MTTDTKFTPGPWEYENGKGIKACGNPLKVAGRTKTALANRALIKAAPDLYAALEVARDRLLKLHTAEDSDGMRQIYAALAKARGEA